MTVATSAGIGIIRGRGLFGEGAWGVRRGRGVKGVWGWVFS